jgi:antitoxin HigA-1
MARTPIHPGNHLAEELEEIGISATELRTDRCSGEPGYLHSQRPAGVAADPALRLGHWFGTSPEFWLNLRSLYELRVARNEVGDNVEKLPRLVDQKSSA